MERSTFTGKVFHAHCDAFLEGSQIATRFAEDDKQYGLFEPAFFLVINSADLLSAIQSQLRKQIDAVYEAKSVTVQLGDAAGELGSEMIGSNCASRLVRQINILRQTCASHFKERYGGSVPTDLDLKPTAAGLRLYPKIPEDKTKLRELAIKYGAIPDAEGNTRDVSNLNVTLLANMFGMYKGAFYLNFRICAPFKARDKPEVLADVKKPRKRAPTKARASSAEGEDAAAASTPAFKRKTPDAAGAPKRQRKSDVEIDPSQYATEDELCVAYVKAGMSIRAAAQMAVAHFAGQVAAAQEGLGDDASEDLLAAGGDLKL
jgi:hypothetical protein